jgi:hypothetical protein
MLISDDGAFVMQVQPDRFYLNWRRREPAAEYPRFSDRDGRQGVLSRVLREFTVFAHFCKSTVGIEPIPARIELAKVDLLAEGVHWSGFRDLADLLPWLKPFTAFSRSDDHVFAVRFEEPRAGGKLSVTLGSASNATFFPSSRRAVKLETRVVKAVSGTSAPLQGLFQEANVELNNVFAELIPIEQRERRFNKRLG